MSSKTILVINPNSNTRVTDGLNAALSGLRQASGIEIECTTLAAGPFGIETEQDIRDVEPLLLREISLRDDCDAYVIACYSDPALDCCRASTGKPVFGMQQSAVAAAVALGRRFGVLALSDASIRRHRSYLEKLGLYSHLAAERPLDLSVDEAARDPRAFERIVSEGLKLRDEDGAGSVILGCAGMAQHRAAAEEALAIPVIEPVQAAVTQALGRLLN